MVSDTTCILQQVIPKYKAFCVVYAKTSHISTWMLS